LLTTLCESAVNPWKDGVAIKIRRTWKLVARTAPDGTVILQQRNDLLSAKSIHWVNTRSSTRGHKARHRGACCENSDGEKEYGRVVGPHTI